jgi:calcineurin-like phosphoesterase family protein
MWVKRVLVILVAIRSIDCMIAMPENKINEKFASFVENLVEDFNQKTSITHDVALLKMGDYKDSKRKVQDVYESILTRLSDRQSIITPNRAKTSNNRDMRKAEISVIVSDVYNSVRCCSLKQLSILIFNLPSLESATDSFLENRTLAILERPIEIHFHLGTQRQEIIGEHFIVLLHTENFGCRLRW